MTCNAEPSAAAGPSILDSEGPETEDHRLTREEQIELECAMDRRASYQNTHPDASESLDPLGNLVDGIVGRVHVLPNGLARRYDGACLSLRNAQRDVKRNPGSEIHAETLRAMERQMLRVFTDVCCHRAIEQVRRMRAA